MRICLRLVLRGSENERGLDMKMRYGLLAGVFLAVSYSWAETPSAQEVLDKFAETQDGFRSFIAKTETDVVKTSRKVWPKGIGYSKSQEFRFDGRRVAVRDSMVGQVGRDLEYSKDNPGYSSNLWDGQTYYRYCVGAKKDDGVLVLTRPRKPRGASFADDYFTNYTGSVAMGYLPGKPVRIDKVLGSAKSLAIRNRMERVGDSMCYVLEGRTTYGYYKVWFDPSRDYNIAKAIHLQGPGDKTISAGYVLQEKERRQTVVENVRYKKAGGKWFPVEADCERRFKYANGSTARSAYHFKVTEIVLNPDHEALKSFVPDDIPDGTMAVDADRTSVEYEWQNGEMVEVKRQRGEGAGG